MRMSMTVLTFQLCGYHIQILLDTQVESCDQALIQLQSLVEVANIPKIWKSIGLLPC